MIPRISKTERRMMMVIRLSVSEVTSSFRLLLGHLIICAKLKHKYEVYLCFKPGCI